MIHGDPEGIHSARSTPAPAASLLQNRVCWTGHSFSTNQLWPQNQFLHLKNLPKWGIATNAAFSTGIPIPPKWGTASGAPRQDFSSKAGGLPAPARLRLPLPAHRGGLPRRGSHAWLYACHRPVVLNPHPAAGEGRGSRVSPGCAADAPGRRGAGAPGVASRWAAAAAAAGPPRHGSAPHGTARLRTETAARAAPGGVGRAGRGRPFRPGPPGSARGVRPPRPPPLPGGTPRTRRAAPRHPASGRGEPCSCPVPPCHPAETPAPALPHLGERTAPRAQPLCPMPR